MADADPATGETTTTITATTHLTLPSHPTPLTYDQLNPKSRATEFLGPIGTAGVTVVATFTAYFLFYACNEATGCPPTSLNDWGKMWDSLGDWPSSAGKLWEWKAMGVYMVWYAFCVGCWAILPGEKVEGNLLRDGRRNTYWMSGASPFYLYHGRCSSDQASTHCCSASESLLVSFCSQAGSSASHGCTIIGFPSYPRRWRWRPSKRSGSTCTASGPASS